MQKETRGKPRVTEIWNRVDGSHHLREVFEVKRHPAPIAWMWISGLSTVMPLLVGSYLGEVKISIFGGLTGYFVGLCDHHGSLGHRLLMAVLSCFISWGGFCAGIFLQQSLAPFLALSAILAYTTGLFSGKGAELERAMVFGGIMFFVSRYALSLRPEMIPSLSLYFVVAFGMAVLGVLVSHFGPTRVRPETVSVKKALRELLTRKASRHYYAATYVITMLLGILIVEAFHIRRGYWLIVTVLLLLKADRQQSVYRIVQRFAGTLGGVMVGEVLIWTQPPIPFLEAGCFLFAALVPLVWYRNYWLVAFCATNLVICLLSIAQHGAVETTLGQTRLLVTVIACVLTLAMVGLSRLIEPFVLKSEEARRI